MGAGDGFFVDSNVLLYFIDPGPGKTGTHRGVVERSLGGRRRPSELI